MCVMPIVRGISEKLAETPIYMLTILEVGGSVAGRRSQSAWRCIQNCGEVLRNRDNRRAVSAVIRRLPSTTSFGRLAESPSR